MPKTRKYSLYEVLTLAPQNKDWIDKILEGYLLHLSKGTIDEDLFDVFTIGYPNRRNTPKIRRSVIEGYYKRQIHTTFQFANPQLVWKALRDQLPKVLQDELSQDAIKIMNESGELENIRYDHKPLVEAYEQSIPLSSSNICIYNVESTRSRYHNMPEFEDVTIEGYWIIGKATISQRVGELIFSVGKEEMPKDSTRNKEEETAVMLDCLYGKRFLLNIEQLYQHLKGDTAERDDDPFGELDPFFTACETLFYASRKPTSFPEVESAIHTILNKIHMDSIANPYEIKDTNWKDFAIGLMHCFTHTPMARSTIEHFKRAIADTTSDNALITQAGYEILRKNIYSSIINDDSSLTRELNKSTRQSRLSPNELERLIQSGQLSINQLVAQFENVFFSLRDPNDGILPIIDVAIKLHKSHPELATQLNKFLEVKTHSSDVSGKSSFPDKDEWYRRIWRTDRPYPSRSRNYLNSHNIRKHSSRTAKKLEQLSAAASRTDERNLTAEAVLGDRTIAINVPSLHLSAGKLDPAKALPLADITHAVASRIQTEQGNSLTR